MALGYETTLRNTRLNAITTAAGANALLRLYSGARPATGGATTTLLAELTCGATFAPAASAGVLTLNAITQDPSANATGTATSVTPAVSVTITLTASQDNGNLPVGESYDSRRVTVTAGFSGGASSVSYFDYNVTSPTLS
jgi:hypothetical protein